MTFSVRSSKIQDLQHWGHTICSKNKLDRHRHKDYFPHTGNDCTNINFKLFSLLFEMTVWVSRSTQIGLLANNVIFGKECEKNNSPNHRK